MNPPQPPIIIPVGNSDYTIQINTLGGGRLLCHDNTVALFTPADLETLSYDIHLALGETR